MPVDEQTADEREPLPPLRPRFAELGSALLAHGRCDEAVGMMVRALAENEEVPSDGVLNEQLAEALEQLGRRDEAWNHCVEALLARPDQARDLVARARSLASSAPRKARSAVLADSRWADVLDDEAVGAEARGAIAAFLGGLALHLGDPAAAEALFQRADQLSGGGSEALAGLGGVLVATGRAEEALSTYRSAQRAADRDDDRRAAEEAALGAAEALVLLGRPQEALAESDASNSEEPALAVRRSVVRARALLVYGRADQALERLRTEEARTGRSSELRLLEALALIALHRNEEAIDVLGRALDRDPTHRQLQLRLIQARVEGQQDLEDLREQLPDFVSDPHDRAALLDDPTWGGRESDGRAHFFRAYLLAAGGDVPGALEAADRALALGLGNGLPNPAEAPVHQLRAELLERSGDAAAAHQALFEAARDYYFRSDEDTAVRLFEAVLRRDPTHRLAMLYLADALVTRASRLPAGRAGSGGDAERLGRRADELWHASMDGGPPEEADWAYVVGAALNEQLRRCGVTPSAESLWSSVAYLECGLLRNRWLQQAWVWLAQTLRELDQVRSAKAVNDRLRTWYPGDLYVLEETIVLLTNVGAHGAALEVIEEREQLLPTLGLPPTQETLNAAWHLAIRAHCAFWMGDHAGAAHLVDRALSVGGDTLRPWVQDLAGKIRRRLGDWAGAGAFFAAVLRRCDPDNLDERTPVAWAYLESGAAENALSLFMDIAGWPGDDSRRSAEMGVGLAELALGDLAVGEQTLAGTIRSAPFPQLLNELEYGLLVVVQNSGADDELPRVVARLRELSAQQRVQLEPLPDAGEDHDAAIDRVELERVLLLSGSAPAEQGAWMRAAAQAALARADAEQGKWERAADRYVELAASATTFPEIAQGLRQAVEGLDRLAEERVIDNPAAASALLQQARELAQLVGQPGRERAEPVSRIADAALRIGDLPTARTEYDEALGLLEGSDDDLEFMLLARSSAALFRSGAAKPATQRLLRALQLREGGDAVVTADQLIEALRPVTTSVEAYWAVDDGWHRVADSSVSENAVLELARHRSLGLLESLVGLTQSDRKHPAWVHPVSVELGTALVPEDTGDTWILFSDYIPAMKARVEAETGVRIPGIRFRYYAGHLDGEYRILLDNVPVVAGMVLIGREFVAAHDTVARGLALDEGVAALDEHGRPGWWVADGQGPGIEPLEMVVRHLEAVVRRNLWRIVDFEAAMSLLSELDLATGPDGASLAVRERVTIARVLRALIADRVSIKDLPTLVRTVTAPSAPTDETALLTAARAAMRAGLPGNRSDDVSVVLPPRVRAAVAAADRLSALPPHAAADILTELRMLLPQDTGSGRVLIAPSQSGRRLLTQLIAAEWPDLAVVAEEELLSGGQTAGWSPAVQEASTPGGAAS